MRGISWVLKRVWQSWPLHRTENKTKRADMQYVYWVEKVV